MSRRKQPAPARLSDDLAGEGTGTGKTARLGQASEVTRRSPVKGRQSRDRRQISSGLNGHGGERTRGRRQSARNRDLQQKQGGVTPSATARNGDSQDSPLPEEAADNNGCVNGLNGEFTAVNRDTGSVNGDFSTLNEDGSGVNGDADVVSGDANIANGDAGLKDDTEGGHSTEGHVTVGSVAGELSDTVSPEVAHGTNGCVNDSQDDKSSSSSSKGSHVGSSSTHSPEVADSSACESRLIGGVGGESTTAGTDQAASSQQPLTGAGAGSRGEALGKKEDGDDDTGIVGDDAEAESSLSSSSGALSDHHTPIDFSGAPQGLATISATMEVGSEGYNASCSIDSMQGTEETGLGESAASGDRCSSQEGDTKSLDGSNGLLSFSAMPSSPSPTNSSSEGTPSKNSMKRRRPFESPESLSCQLCNIDFQNAHELTLHVRSHNTASSHSCTICGKKLSSTSSLDRHMLIHSGERPFTCPLCNMSFTTNGNMHRHLRTHEKGGELPPPDYVVKHDYAKPRKRVPSRRVLENIDGELSFATEQDGQSPSPKKRPIHGSEKKMFGGDKKVSAVKKSPAGEIVGSADLGQGVLEQAMDLSARAGRVTAESSMEGAEDKEEELSCPICSKTFLCRYGLQTHIEQHPNKVLECMICNATFRNQKGLRMHVHMAHRKNKPPSPKQGNCIFPSDKEISSMTELGFAEFSSPKFPLIAQVWCEKNSSRLSKTESALICDECDKPFPCLSALNLHREKSHSIMEDTDIIASSSKVVSLMSKEETVSRDVFLAALNLKPVTPPLSPQKKVSSVVDAEGDLPGAPILNSILSKPSLTSPEKAKTSLLQQHLEASPLLAMNHFSNPLGGKPHVTNTKSVPMKHSPVKGTTAGNDPAPIKPECSATDLCQTSKESGLEPRSGDVAMEMHTPDELACNTAMDVSPKATATEAAVTDGDVSGALEDIEEEPCDLSSTSNKKRGEHVCKYCKKVFPFTSTLKVHMRSHMGLMPYKCMLCDYASADKSTLVRHMRTHSGERPYSCKVCDFAFTTKANCERHVRKRHHKNTKEEAEEVIVHNPVPKHENESKYSSPCTVCKICDRDFKFFRDLQNHLRVHEKTPQKPFTCTKCQVGFSSLSNCARHIMRRHEEVKADDVESCITVFQHSDEKNAPIIKVPTYIKEEPRSDTPVFNEEGVQVEPLDFSVKATTKNDKSSRTKRQQRNSIYTEDSPLDLSMPKSSLDKKVAIRTTTSAIGKYRFKEAYHKFYSQTVDALVCPHCTMTFSRGSLLKAHIRTHTAERPFRCTHCAAAFTMKATLEAHILRRHTDPYQLQGQQSFIARSATPMQFKLMAKSASTLRYTSRPTKMATAIPLISPNTPVGAAEQVKVEQVKFVMGKVGPSPHSSVGSDSSGELASVSKMLAAADSSLFKSFLPPPESRSPVPATDIFHQEMVNDKTGAEIQKIFTNVSNSPPEMRDYINSDLYEFESKDQTKVPDSTDASTSVMDEDAAVDQYKPEGMDQYEPAGLDPYEPDDEHEGELQIVEDEKMDEQTQGDVTQDGEDKKDKRGTKFESKQCCPYCGRRFPWISSLRRHILTHTGLKPYQCPQCGANFSTKSNCERHIVRRHGGARPGSLGGSVPGGQDQPFMCPECKGFKCTTRTQLQAHYEQDHPQIKFADIYPEAKKVANASVAIVNQQLEAKLAEDAPLCLSKKPSEGGSTDGAHSNNDIPTDLSTSKSKSPKLSKPKPLKVKLFMRNGDVTSSCMGGGTQILSKVAESALPVLDNYDPLPRTEGGNSGVGVATNLVQNEGANTPLQLKVEAIDEEKGSCRLESDGERDARSRSPSALSLTVPSFTVGSMPTLTTKPLPKGKKDRARFECTQCCKRFKTALTLEKHEKIHEVDHPFHCTDCKATFTTKFNCHRHMMKLHNKSKEEVANWPVKDEAAGSMKNGLATNSAPILSDQELENMSSSSINMGDSISALGESRVTSRNPTPVLQEKGKKRPAASQVVKKTKSPKLDEALMSGAVLDLQGNSDKLMAVENWLNSDIKLQNGYSHEDEMSSYDSDIPILNPESPTGMSQEENSQPSEAWSTKKKPSGSQQQQQLYMASFLEDEDSMVAQDVADPSDVFSGGQGEEKNDIISNLLGIKDASVLDQMLESADSAARLLGVTDG